MQILAVLLLIAGCMPTQASACVCSPGEREQRPLEQAEMVFVGRPVKIEVVPPAQASGGGAWQSIKDAVSSLFRSGPTSATPVRPRFLDSVRVTFEVSNYIKGAGPKTISVMTGYGGSDCGLPVSISKKYTIYARCRDGALRTSYCFGSTEYVRAGVTPSCSAGR